MKISIITPVFNNANTIKDCLNSIYTQTYAQHIEHIIIDNCSTDTSLDIILSHHFSNRIIISEKDNGLYDAINKGIEKSTGTIIGVLHADDFYVHNQVLEHIVPMFSKDLQGVYANLYYVKRNEINTIVRQWKAGEYTHQSFLYGWMPPHPTCFVTKQVYEKNGLYRLDLGTAADYEWIIRNMFKNKIPFQYLDEYIIAMRTGGASNISLKNRLIAHLNDYKAWKVNGLNPYWFSLFLKPVRKINQFFT